MSNRNRKLKPNSVFLISGGVLAGIPLAGYLIILLGAFFNAESIIGIGFSMLLGTGAFLDSVMTAMGLELSLVTFGLAAVYCIIGAGYFFSAAQKCFNSEKNVLELFSEFAINKDNLSVKSVISLVGAILWSPFIVLGGGCGMAAKAVVNKFFPAVASVSIKGARGEASEEGPEGSAHTATFNAKFPPARRITRAHSAGSFFASAPVNDADDQEHAPENACRL